jgi:hypothetical protein
MLFIFLTLLATNATLFGVSHDCPISPAALTSGSSCNITSSFTPLTDGSQSSLVSIIYGPDAPRAGDINAKFAIAGRSSSSLKGNPAISYDPHFWDFGNVARNTNVEQVFILTNTSNASVFIANSNFDNSGSFVITANTCPSGATPLTSGATCQITVRFSPTSDTLENPTLRTFYGPDQARSGNNMAGVIIAAAQ